MSRLLERESEKPSFSKLTELNFSQSDLTACIDLLCQENWWEHLRSVKVIIFDDCIV